MFVSSTRQVTWCLKSVSKFCWWSCKVCMFVFKASFIVLKHLRADIVVRRDGGESGKVLSMQKNI